MLCVPGYRERLCSGCEPGYYQDGSSCRECTTWAKIQMPLSFTFWTAWTMFLAFHIPKTDSGIVNVAMFHWQMLGFLFTVRFPLPNTLHSVVEATEGAVFGANSLDCFYDKHFKRRSAYLFFIKLIVALSAVPAYLVFIAIAYVAGIGLAKDRTKYTNRCKKAFNFILFSQFFPLTSIILQGLANQDAKLCTRGVYMLSAPYLECTDWYAVILRIICIILLPIVLVGIPVYFIRYFYQHHRDLSVLLPTMGFIFNSYEDKYWYWEGLVLIRKITIALALSFIDNTATTLLTLLFATLSGSLIAQLSINPFIVFTTNVMETLSLATLQLNFYSTTISGLLENRQPLVEWLLSLWNFTLLFAMVGILLREKWEYKKSQSTSNLAEPLLLATGEPDDD